MEKCPQCSSVYTDDTKYCPNDGQLLISEIFPLPSQVSVDDEEITIVRHAPVIVDWSGAVAPNNELPQSQISPQIENTSIKSGSNSKNYLIFLIIGLLLGGGMVLATLFLAKSLFQNNDANNINSSLTVNSNQNQNNGKSTNTDSQANKQITANTKHLEKTSAGDEEFNGRVITLNAYVRSSPSRNASETDILPIDDRLNITTREDPNSPWFHVVCEHGASGWMHGNTIEYTR